MYESFYRLKENPFGMTPNPRFFYKSSGHRDALAYLARGVFEKKGFLALSGEVGLGKTTVLRSFVQTFEPCLDVAFILNTNLTFEEMLYMFLKDFGCEFSGSSKIVMLEALNDFLIQSYARNNNPLLVIDEAQNLSIDALEELRMLSNLETNDQKLMQIVLVGQPELEFVLERHDLRQLRQRIPGIYRMHTLSEKEVDYYIKYRLLVAGLRKGALSFTEHARAMIHAFSKGVPRLINLICERALYHGSIAGVIEIDGYIIEKSARELHSPGFTGTDSARSQ